MAGRRPLSKEETRMLIRVLRRSHPRTRALVTTGLFTGFRSYEFRRLTVGQVWRDGQILPAIGVQPRNRKGGYGVTHFVPVGPELRRALEAQIADLLAENPNLSPRDALFPSRKKGKNGRSLAIGKKQVYKITMSCYQRAHILNDGRLGTHSLRKSFARTIYERSGHDLLVTKKALGHSSCAVTEQYLEVDGDKVVQIILGADWTRKPRKAG